MVTPIRFMVSMLATVIVTASAGYIAGARSVVTATVVCPAPDPEELDRARQQRAAMERFSHGTVDHTPGKTW